MKRLLAATFAAVCVMGCATTQNSTTSATGSADTTRFNKPIDLIPQALGAYSWKITTRSSKAQEYFTQGMQLRYAYNVDAAARSMAAARRIDPDCAMCYWGEAFALGSFLNGGMTDEKARHAHAAITKAAALAPTHATELERQLIAAATVRYPENYDPKNRRPVDEAFAAAMAKVHETYPDNHEVATVYAVALFLLEERRGYRDVNDPDLIRLHGVLTGVLEEDITHPGACHLYIHATESSQHPDRALACAELGRSPRSSFGTRVAVVMLPMTLTGGTPPKISCSFRYVVILPIFLLRIKSPLPLILPSASSRKTSKDPGRRGPAAKFCEKIKDGLKTPDVSPMANRPTQSPVGNAPAVSRPSATCAAVLSSVKSVVYLAPKANVGVVLMPGTPAI